MSLGDWFRGLFSPRAGAQSAEDQAVLREEYGGSDPGAVVREQPTQSGGVAGMPGLEGIEVSDAAKSELEAFEPPPDQAP
jgi:hypothetical protein